VDIKKMHPLTRGQYILQDYLVKLQLHALVWLHYITNYVSFIAYQFHIIAMNFPMTKYTKSIPYWNNSTSTQQNSQWHFHCTEHIFRWAVFM